MRHSVIRAELPVRVAGVTVIPVTRVSVSGWGSAHSASFSAAKYPTGVVVVSPSAKRAFRATGEEVLLDQFIEEVPGMREVLADL